MRTREFIASLVGGVAVYVACASNAVVDKQSEKLDGGFVETGDETRADSPLQDIMNVIDGVLPDVVAVDGPLDAKAEDAGSSTIVVTGKCDKTGPASGGGTVSFSEFSFPGKTITQLAKAKVVMCHINNAANGMPLPFRCVSFGFYVSDGAIAVSCNPTMTDSIQVILD